MSMCLRRIPVAFALLLTALGAAACGDPAPFPPEHWLPRLGSDDEARRQEAVDALGRLGRQDPERVGALLVGLLERRAEQVVLGVRVEPDFTGLSPEAQERLLPLLALGVRERLRLAGGSITRVVSDKASIEAYLVRPAGKDVEASQALAIAEAGRPGSIDLRVELPAPFAPTAERPVSPWTGDLVAYDAWLAAEQALLAAAGAGHQAYRPGADGRRLLLRALGGAAEGSGAVPVLEPAGSAQTFTEADLVFAPQDDLGVPALRVSAAVARAEDLRAFLKAHAGLRLWLVIDGRAALSTRIPVQVPDAVVFRVQAPTLEEGRTRAAEIAALALLGRFPVPMRASAKPRAPVIAADNPLARAIVAVGPGIEPRLDALVKKDPSWGPLVEALKEAILKGRTLQR